MWLITLFVVLFSVWLYKRHRRMTVLARAGFNGPKPNFLLGHLDEAFGDNNVPNVSKMINEYGSIVAYYLGGSPALLVTDEELLKAVQIKDFHLFMDRQSFVKGTGHPDQYHRASLLFCERNRWRELRSILTPTFNASKLRSMISTIDSCVEELVENFEAEAETGSERDSVDDSKDFDCYELYQRFTMDVIARTAFGIRCNSQKSQNHPFVINSRAVLMERARFLVALNMFFPEFEFILYPLRVAWLHIQEMFTISGTTYLHNACREILEARRQQTTDRRDLLQAMMDARMASDEVAKTKASSLTATSGEPTGLAKAEPETAQTTNSAPSPSTNRKFTTMTDAEIVGTSFIFLEAGYETSSTTLANVTHMLIEHREWQDRLRKECQELFERDSKFDYNVVSDLPSMEAVIFETLRLYPPVSYLVNRIAVEDYRFGDRVIPKGTMITAPLPQLHRDPSYWPEPDKFDPMRFYKEAKAQISPIYWQPFGQGPRNCVGMRFAMLEVKMALANILIKYRLEPGPRTQHGDIKLRYSPLLMGPANGIFIRAVPL